MRSERSVAKGIATAAFLMALLLVPSARAQQSSAAPQSQEAFENGLEAARQQDYAAAYRYFQVAAERETEMAPATMYNLALAAAHLPQHELRAAAGFRAYLVAAPDADNAQEVLREIRRLQIAFERRLTAILDTIDTVTPASRAAFDEGLFRRGSDGVNTPLPPYLSAGDVNGTLWDLQIAAWLYLGRSDRAAAAIRRYGRRPGEESDPNWPLEEPFGSNERAEIPYTMRTSNSVWYRRFYYHLYDGDLDGAMRTIEQHPMGEWDSGWFSLGCAALEGDREDLRVLAVSRFAAMNSQQPEQRRTIVRNLVALGEVQLATSWVDRAGAPPEEAVALRTRIAETTVAACNATGVSRQGRYRELKRIATGAWGYDGDDTRLQELIESRRSDFVSREYRNAGRVRFSALYEVSLNVMEFAQALRHVHGPFQ